MNKHIELIKRNGFCVIPQMYSKQEIELYLEAVKHIYEETKYKICQDTPRLNKEQPNIYNLQNKDKMFIDLVLGNLEVENILKYFLNDIWYKAIPQNQPNYILRHMGARSSNNALPLHIDSFIPFIGDYPIAMQVAIMLEDSTIQNGCTTGVPGSHNWGLYANNEIDFKNIEIEAKAGDVLIWDSRLWHGTTANKTTGTRWAIISTFTRWFVKQMFDIPKALPEETKQQLSQKQLSILGFNTIPYITEYDGIEMKKGY